MSKRDDILEELDTLNERVEALEKRLNNLKPDYETQDASLERWIAELLGRPLPNLNIDDSGNAPINYRNLSVRTLLYMARNHTAEIDSIEHEITRRIWER